MSAHGILLNTFEELEPWYLESYDKAMGTNVWEVGPLSLCNSGEDDMASRGRGSTISVERCMAWLDGMQPKSVMYVSFGSLTYVKLEQLVEIGNGLMDAESPFLWVVRGVGSDDGSPESEIVEKWLGEFEGRIGGRGMIVKGWAPQLLILNHKACGGFMTHCGWNSVIEGLAAGVPMVTWPFMWDQFLNERLVVDVVGVGIGVGVKVPGKMEENNRVVHYVLVRREEIEKGVRGVIGGEKMKERASLIKEKALKAVGIGGSSYESIEKVIEFVVRAWRNENFVASGEEEELDKKEAH